MPGRRRSRFVAVGPLLLLLAGCGTASVAGPPGTSAAAATRGNALHLVANATSVDSTLEFLTQSAGIFAKNGLNVTLDGMSGQASMDALIAGHVDAVAHSGPQTDLSAIAGGAQLKIVGTLLSVYNTIIVAPSSITSLDQLRGKKVGGQSALGTNVQGMRRALQNAGLKEGTDYTFVSTGNSAGTQGAYAALVAHQIDAAPLDDQYARKAVADGTFHALLDLASPEANISSAFTLLTFRQEYIQQHPDLTQKAVDSLMEGVRYLHDHKAETEALMKSHSKIDDPVELEASYQRQVLILSKAPLPTKEQFDDVLATMPKDAPKISESQLVSYLEPRFVQDAIKRGLADY